MKESNKNALILYYSCSGNTEYLANQIADTLGKNNWNVSKNEFKNSIKLLTSNNIDLLILGIPVHYWTVPSAVTGIMKEFPRLDGIPVFLVCTYGGCIIDSPLYTLAGELEQLGAYTVGGAAVLMPHSCHSSDGNRLGNIDLRFGKGQPDNKTLSAFLNSVLIASEKSKQKIKQPFDINSLKINSKGKIAGILGKLMTTERKISSMPPLNIAIERCTGCGKCLAACLNKSIKVSDNKAYIDNKKCRKCYACTEICKEDAIITDWVKIEKLTKVMHLLSKNMETSIIV